MTIRGTILFAAGMASALSAGWLAFPRVLYQTRQQPLEFNHKVHTSDKVGSKCDSCHSLSADGRFSGIPALATCAGCHPAPVTDKASEKKLIDEYVSKNREIPWLVYARQPENVHFSHATHINLAKVACERCHGDQGQTEKLRPYQENRISGYSRDIWGPSISRISLNRGTRPGMKMDDCAQCHTEKGVTAGCMACHK